jgi:outer membrane protein assembly factor BamA
VIDGDVGVEEGEQYRLKTIRFVGRPAFPESALRAQFPISEGSVFNRSKIGSGLENLRQLYGAKRYVNLSAVAETMVAVASHQISLSIDLDEGMNFRCGKLLVQGGESRPGAREKVLSTWKTYEGAGVYPRAVVEISS